MVNLPYYNTIPVFSSFKNRIKAFLYQKLTKNSINLFLRNNDIITCYPQISGIFEPRIVNFINYLTINNYNDFLLDIGANIGLISCQVGNDFKDVYMFEPNKYCYKIAEVNSAISFKANNYKIYNFGLGTENSNSILNVPKHNWGGAFIKDNSNSYNDNILSGKDGFNKIDNANYIKVDIELRKGSEVLTELFSNLVKKNLNMGVIKIDVEGYEFTILKELAAALPPEVKCYIIFESWDKKFNVKELLNSFNGRAKLYKLNIKNPWKENSSNFLKLFHLFINSRKKYSLIENKSEDYLGDIVLKID